MKYRTSQGFKIIASFTIIQNNRSEERYLRAKETQTNQILSRIYNRMKNSSISCTTNAYKYIQI